MSTSHPEPAASLESLDPAAAFLALSNGHEQEALTGALLRAIHNVRMSTMQWGDPKVRLGGLAALDRVVITMTSGNPTLQDWFRREALTQDQLARAEQEGVLQHIHFSALQSDVLQKLQEALSSVQIEEDQSGI